MTTPFLTADGQEPRIGQTLFTVYRARLTQPAWWYHARVALCDVVVRSIHDDGTVAGRCCGPSAKVKPGSDRVLISSCYADLREAMKAYRDAVHQLDEYKRAAPVAPSLDKTA